MTFNSIGYLIFLPFVLVCTFLLPKSWRWWWLLMASYFFYGFGKLSYLLLLIFSTSITFFTARKIAATEGKTRRHWCYLAVGIDLALLFVFKYTAFAYQNLQAFLAWFAIHLPPLSFALILPPGISFYTFQSLSYTIDVYRRHQTVEKHFGLYALYIGFFPQLVAGPIEQAKHLLPQLRQQFTGQFGAHSGFKTENLVIGGRLIVWGFFKKLVIADNIGEYLRFVFNDLEHYGTLALVLAAFLFVYQIYADFSAYSLIAMGSARLLGIELMLNFDRPFVAVSYNEIWQRWHISLTQWIRTYLYLPLGGRHVHRVRYYANIVVVYLLMGLWHGAAWTFVLFGWLHAFTFILADLTQSLRQPINAWIDRHLPEKVANVVYRFVVVSLFAFNCFPFRFDKVESWWAAMMRPLFMPSVAQIPYHYLTLILPMIVFAEYLESYQERGDASPFGRLGGYWWRWLVYVFLLFAILLLGNYNSNTFYYFQF